MEPAPVLKVFESGVLISAKTRTGKRGYLSRQFQNRERPLEFTDPTGMEKYSFSSTSTFFVIIPGDIDPIIQISGFYVTIRTNVVVDTDKETITVTSITSDNVYKDYATTSITEATLKIKDKTVATGILEPSKEGSLTTTDSIPLGTVEFDLPKNAAIENMSIETDTSYKVETDNGTYFPGRQKVIVAL